jgi:hypothetical protein
MLGVWRRVKEEKRDKIWSVESPLMFDFSQLRLGVDLGVDSEGTENG